MADDVVMGAEQRSRAEIADLLRQEIASGKYPVGTKMPSYRQLAERLGAAPNTVGEAMRQLAAEGRVKVKQNAGAVVCDPAEQPQTTEQHLQEVRAGLVDMRDHLREVRRTVDELDNRVADLLSGLPNE